MSDTTDLAADCFFGFVSLAIQRLPYFPHIFQCRFLLPRYQRPLNTQHCIYMSLQKLITTVKLCTACIFTVIFSWMLFPVWPRRTFSAIIRSPVWAHARPLRIVVAVMADIRAGVEAKTAVEDLSAKSFPRYG